MSGLEIANRVSAANRRRKWDLFLSEMSPTANMRVLDVGFSDLEYSPSDNYIEKAYPYPDMLTALGINEPVEFKQRYPAVSALRYDGSVFPFADRSFDLCWSNAVLEHVGAEDEQVAFIREIRRVAKRAFFTTPNRYFPVEVHTRTPLLHFLPKPMFNRYLERTGRGWATGDYMHLLSARELHGRLASAGIERYRLVRNRLLGFTMDFVVIAELE